MKRTLSLILLLLVSGSARSEFMLKQGDRVVFFGDSITEFGNYTNPVESYLTLRYPELKLTFFNAGWAGDRTDGALYRLERDVLKLKPTLVTLCFGMNDGYYMKAEASIGDLYVANLTQLVQKIRASGARVAMLSVGIVDEEGEKNSWMKDINYNASGLEMIRKRAMDFAKKQNIPIVDIHSLMSEVTAKARAADKDFSMHPDGIHPDEGGGMIMAYALLKSLGVPERRESLTLNLADGSVTSTAGLAAGALQKNADGSLRLKIKMNGLPYYVPEKARRILPYLPWQQDFNHFEFKVVGLKGKASLQFGNEPSAYLPAADFEKGFAMEDMQDSAPLDIAHDVEDFAVEKNKIYLEFWRNLALKPNYNQWEVMRPEPHAMGISANNRLAEIENEMATPPADGFEITVWPWPTQGELLNNNDWAKAVSISPALPWEARLNEAAVDAAGLTTSANFWSLRRLNVDKPENNLGFFGKGGKEKAVAYVALSLDSPVEQAASLKIGKDDGFEAWLNGKPAGKSAVGGSLKPDSDTLSLKLKRGPNLLLIRAMQQGGGWGLVARFDGLKKPIMSWPAALELSGGSK
jgi:lysophospholipase L1-like esterase